MRNIVTKILLGDSREVLKTIEDNSIDLIVTSPPYADRRKNTYGGIAPNKYVEWFLPIGQELLRILKPTGTFILNIKEKAANGERNVYVIELILALRNLGWLWTEEFIWHKKNSYPGKWPNRFRDAWERPYFIIIKLLHEKIISKPNLRICRRAYLYLSSEFSQEFCNDGNIDWVKLVEYNSGFKKIIKK